MRVNDLWYDNKSIFYYINKAQPLPMVDLDVTYLDILFQSMYGDRQVSKLADPKGEITEEFMIQLGTLLSIMFSDKWDRIYEVIEQKVPLETYNLTTTEIIEDEGTSTTNTTNEQNKTDSTSVTGYNSEDFVDDSMKTLDGVDSISSTGANSNKKERVTTVTGNIKNSLEDRINVIKYLKDSLVYDIMFVDVVQRVGKLLF